MTGMQHRHPQEGATLVELLVSIVIVSISAASVLGVLSMNVGASADPMQRHQAMAIAESYLEEIFLRPIDDPDGVDGEAARASFDDLDDYNGLVDAGAADQFGVPLAGLGDYTVSVSVGPSSGLGGLPAGDVLRVDVQVVRGADISYTLSAYRARY